MRVGWNPQSSRGKQTTVNFCLEADELACIAVPRVCTGKCSCFVFLFQGTVASLQHFTRISRRSATQTVFSLCSQCFWPCCPVGISALLHFKVRGRSVLRLFEVRSSKFSCHKRRMKLRQQQQTSRNVNLLPSDEQTALVERVCFCESVPL